MRFSLARANRWLASIDDYVARVGGIDSFGNFARNGATYMGGIPTAIILAGDDLTVAPWMLSHAILAQASALVKPSSVEPLTAFLFVKAAVEKGIRHLNLLHLDSFIRRGSRLHQDHSGINRSIRGARRGCNRSANLRAFSVFADAQGHPLLERPVPA